MGFKYQGLICSTFVPVFLAPNGASMRPNTPKMHRLVRTLRGTSACIYSIPAGL